MCSITQTTIFLKKDIHRKYATVCIDSNDGFGLGAGDYDDSSLTGCAKECKMCLKCKKHCPLLAIILGIPAYCM